MRGDESRTLLSTPTSSRILQDVASLHRRFFFHSRRAASVLSPVTQSSAHAIAFRCQHKRGSLNNTVSSRTAFYWSLTATVLCEAVLAVLATVDRHHMLLCWLLGIRDLQTSCLYWQPLLTNSKMIRSSTTSSAANARTRLELSSR